MFERRHGPSRVSSRLAQVLLGAVALTALAAGSAQAQLVSKAKNASATAAYWTPERLRSAKPLPDPIAQGSPRDRAATKTPAGKRQSSPSGPGGDEGGNVTVAPSIQPKSEGASTNAAGSLGATFTNEREFPTATLRKNYPWRTVGKLFFTGAGGGDFLCSASVISRRVVATAGHCVFDASLHQFHTNWFFVPGYDNGKSPFGGFSWSLATTTNGWANGGGGVPNVSDFGMIVFADKVVNRQVRRIGDLTGWLGWETNVLAGNNIMLEGYPCNLDSCVTLQKTAAQVFRTVAPNNGEIGSDQGGGSSGGPWAQDFGRRAVGQPPPVLNGNIVVGIQSYRYNDPAIRVVGSSILNDEWVQIWNTACASTGNCS